jgi:type III restriction enzyme
VKFTLKDYQDEAVRDVLSNLRKASKRWHEDSDKHAFSLTATTGAGKNVMAAAAFEALFHGDDNFDFEADPGAVVIWFSDDPVLNEQTRFRLLEASDRLAFTDLVVVQNTFNREKFEAGKLYFLNTQKLGKKSLLVRGHDPEEDRDRHDELFPQLRPDLRSNTIWDTIQSTIEDPSLTLYLVLDEAHRGMGSPNTAALRDKSTIVKRLINGAGSVPAIPVVWGISATVERFNTAMAGAEGRSTGLVKGHDHPGRARRGGPVRYGARAPRDGQDQRVQCCVGRVCRATRRRGRREASYGLPSTEHPGPK